MRRYNANDIRLMFVDLLDTEQFMNVDRESKITTISGGTTIELVGASFIADTETIFGSVDTSYVQREHNWYMSQPRNVKDIPGGAPTVWQAVASKDGTINSNYGWCVYSKENGEQFERVISELIAHPNSRRAVIIYTRPTMWEEYAIDGRSDFMCTNAVQYVIRDGHVNAIVQMRSNDVIFGYKNDRAWQLFVLGQVAKRLNLPVGELFWNVGSLHVYSRHFYLVDHYARTGELSVTKSRYKELYPDSRWNA